MQTSTWARAVFASCIALILGACANSPTGGVPLVSEPEPVATTQPVTRKPANRAGHLDGQVTRIALGDLFAIQQSGELLLYDVRPAFFHSLGNIPGSVSWPKSAYAKQLEKREAEIRSASASGRPVVLYCTDLACPDAREVATSLAARGHDVRVLEGGWEAWKAGGLPGS